MQLRSCYALACTQAIMAARHGDACSCVFCPFQPACPALQRLLSRRFIALVRSDLALSAASTAAHARFPLTLHGRSVLQTFLMLGLNASRHRNCERAHPALLHEPCCALHLYTSFLSLLQKFVMQDGMPAETAMRIYRRYLQLEPMHTEEYIAYLRNKVTTPLPTALGRTEGAYACAARSTSSQVGGPASAASHPGMSC